MRTVPRLGLRKEVLILLPVALLVFIVLSTFTLLSYRNAIRLLVEERREEAARWARVLVGSARGETLPTAESLKRALPRARGIAVISDEGLPLVQVGSFAELNLLLPVRDRTLTEAVGVGPGERVGDVVAGFAPFGPAERRRYMRVDLPATVLAGQKRNLPVLTTLVLTVNTALALLVFLFLRHLLAPWETLLERAKKLGRAGSENEDEIAFLLETFDQALAALAQRSAEQTEDDIAVLERALSASLESGLLLLDREGKVLALNPVGSALLGVGLPRTTTSVDELLAPHPELRRIVLEAVSKERTIQRHECLLQKEERSLTVGLTVHPLRRDDGGVRGFLVLFADLTEVQQQADERHLAESLYRIGELAAGVAHEMRNSLASLRGYLTLIERRPEEESIQDYLREIRSESDHLQRVLEDFLSFARPGTVRLERVELEGVLRRAASDPLLSRARVRIESCDAGEPMAIRGDAQLLERALRNLLHNAEQAQEGSGTPEIGVRLFRDSDELLVHVEDRGCGIPEEMRERLFVPFATGRADGIGLGLALTHRIVDLHGGRIRLEDRPGGGTRAVLAFPVDRIVT